LLVDTDEIMDKINGCKFKHDMKNILEISGLIDFYNTPAKMLALFRKKDKEATETPNGTTICYKFFGF
jgi:hypothetical protein